MVLRILQNLKNSFNDYIRHHLITNILLLLLTIVILVVDLDYTSDFIIRLITTLFLTAMFSVLGETYTKDNKKRSIFFVIGLIFSTFISQLILDSDLTRYLTGIVLLLGSSILYFMVKNSSLKSSKFITNSFTNLFKFGIIGGVLNIGIMLILGLISILLFDIDFSIFSKVELIILVLYFIPALLISLENGEEENKFIYILINYVLIPLVFIATIVIYLYLIKLLITLKLPHTSTFYICAILLSLGIPIVFMALSYDDRKISYKIASALKKLFIPLVLLQIFSLSLRISNYGITATRYFGIILIILGIVSIIVLNKNNGDDCKSMLLVCMILSITTFIIPYINIYDLPNYMQINRLKQILPEGKNFSELTNSEVENVRSIYFYVEDKKYYPDYLSKDELDELLKNYRDKNYYDNYIDYDNNYIDYDNEDEKINISNYNEIEPYSFRNYTDFTIKLNNGSYDLTEFCKEIHNYDGVDVDNYIKEKSLIELDDNTYLYITNLTLNYDKKHLSIKGFILYK